MFYKIISGYLFLLIINLYGCVYSPNMLQQDEVACIGHRGDLSNELENSTASFLSAYNISADGVEFDVRETKDQIAVVMHDLDMRQVAKSKPGKQCPLTIPVKDLTFDEIQNNCQLNNDEEIPTLESVLSLFQNQDFTLLIEFKVNPSDKTLNLFDNYSQETNNNFISIISFSIDLRNVRPTKRRFKTKTLLNREVYQPDFYELFDGVDTLDIAELFIKRLQYSGKIISLYDVNTSQEFRYAFNQRVNYITTDKLQDCLATKRNEA